MVAIKRVRVSSRDIEVWLGAADSVGGSAACAIHSQPEYLRSRTGKRGCEVRHLPQCKNRLQQRTYTDRCERSWAGAQGELVDSANSGSLRQRGAITAPPRVDIWSTASARAHERCSY